MSGLAVTRTVVIGEGGEAPLAVTVRELTVGEIRAWLAGLAGLQLDLVDALLLGDITPQDLARLSSLTLAQVETLTPSQLRLVLDAAREVNADFFALLGKIVSLGQTQLPFLSEPSPA